MSLRKRPDGSNEAKGGQQRPQQRLQKGRDATKSRVDDRIKKRMSMRYADISEPSRLSIPNIPSLPTGPRLGILGKDQDSQEKLTTSPDALTDSKKADILAMGQENFDPEAYLKVKLGNSTEAELKALQSSLKASKAATDADLQKNVYENYELFVSISKEISTLENDMLELKESLSEWKAMPSLLQVDDSAAADRRRVTRSSVADLRTLYATQLQALHTSIEGSAKFVPATPGRHVVAEVGDVSALNPATYKVEHTVHFVLLDDALLMAKRRRKKTGSNGRLVAERCWMLNEVVIQDSAEANNVIKVRHGKETHVYRIERAKDKKIFLSAFRQASEELAARKRKQREGEHERRRSVWAEGNRNTLAFPNPETMPALPEWLSEIAAQEGLDGTKEKAERDARWIGDFADDLTVAISLRQWDEAVALVENGETRLTQIPLLAPKLTPLKTSLISALLHTLADPMQRKSSVVHLTSLLERLHAGAAARSSFLTMRGELMRKRVRALRFEGSVEVYISDLAVVVFTGIKHTADWFLASFRENDTASSLVQWAREQIESYAEMFKKQVHGSDVAPQTVQACLEITRLQSKKLLKDNSLDFSHLLEQLLAPPSPRVTPPSFARRDTAPLSPPVFSEALASSTPDARYTRPPRILPPRSRDRPASSLDKERTVVHTPRREGMI